MQQRNSFRGRSSRPKQSNGPRPGGSSRPQSARFGGNRHGSRPNRNAKKGSAIHPSKFVNKTVVERVAEVYQPSHQFDDFALNTQLKSTLARTGFTAPSAIQDQAIPIALTGRDVIGLANTGTGKTVAFLLPILEKLNGDPQRLSVLIMAPTRELAQQINDEFRRFADGMRLYSSVVVGGMPIDRQIREIQRRPHVVIGTPGRLKDLINRRSLDLSHINTWVLDEADRMLDMGFVNDIRFVAGLLPNGRQTLCFSATMTPDIAAIVNDFMRDPETVSVRTGETSDHVHQDVIEARDKTHKIEILKDLLVQDEYEKVLVFGETKFGVQRLAQRLTTDGIPAEAIHGNKTQGQRQRALKAFKQDAVRVLVATDVAARGLDISDVSHVINFDPPKVYEDYVHRIGRTGRGGKTGKAITFIDQRR